MSLIKTTYEISHAITAADRRDARYMYQEITEHKLSLSSSDTLLIATTLDGKGSDRIVGLVSYRYKEYRNLVKINDVLVRPSARRNHVATRMINRVIDIAESGKRKGLHVFVCSRMYDLAAFFSSVGFLISDVDVMSCDHGNGDLHDVFSFRYATPESCLDEI